MPAFLSWKYWTQKRQRKHKAKKVTTDYIYLQWHFRSQEESTEETYKTYDVVDNIDKTCRDFGTCYHLGCVAKLLARN